MFSSAMPGMSASAGVEGLYRHAHPALLLRQITNIDIHLFFYAVKHFQKMQKTY
jgi:hypothetical protein